MSEIKKNINETRINIENSIVKNSVKKYNEYKTIRLFYADQIQKLIQENSDVQAEIEITAKNPKKISPAVANSNLRAEVKSLELQITERSKEIREKEREKLQESFRFEEKLKVLNGLKGEVKKESSPTKTETRSPIKNNTLVKPANSLSLRKIEQKRDTLIGILGQEATEGMTKEVLKVLKGVGQPGQGLASKVLELNRSQFPQTKSLVLK